MSEKHIITIKNEKYVLPIPMPWEIVDGQKISTVDLMNFGEVEDGSKPAPRTVSLQRFFPTRNMGFVTNAEFRDKWEYVRAFKEAKDKSIEVEYSITGTPIDIKCKITNFTYGREDGTGNVKYTLDLKENKKTIEYQENDTTIGEAHVTNDGYGHFWEVKDGDTVFSICKWAYGDSTKFKTLLDKNNLKNINQVKVGMFLCL